MISEIDCSKCFRRHVGAEQCPFVGPTPLTVTVEGGVVTAVTVNPFPPLTPATFEEILASLRERAVLLPDDVEAGVPARAVDSTLCGACGAAMEHRTVERRGTGMSGTVSAVQEDYCPVCEVSGSVPRAFRWARFDGPLLAERVRLTSALVEGKAAAAAGRRRVTLVGKAGSGKTSLVAAMFRLRAERGARNLFALAWRLGLARAQHKLGEGEPEIVQAAISAPLLVLDDMGAERDVPTNAVGDIVLERHAENKPTWITTAMSRREMTGRYGGGVARRVLDMSETIYCDKKPEKTT